MSVLYVTLRPVKVVGITILCAMLLAVGIPRGGASSTSPPNFVSGQEGCSVNPSEAWLCGPSHPHSNLPPPSFVLMRLMPNGSRVAAYYDPQPNPGQTTWTFGPDGYLNDATLTYRGDDQWTLTIHAKAQSAYADAGPANEIWFPYRDPYRQAPLPLPLAADARAYFGIQGGLSQSEQDSQKMGAYTWGPLSAPYPGGSSASLLILADGQRAQLIAAINDPPQRVDMRHSGGQTAFIFQPPTLATPAGAEVRVLLSEVSSDVAAGYQPWQVAAQLYKDWLDVHSPRPQYSAWMERGEGFLNVQLQNYPTPAWAQDALTPLWAGWKDYFGWVQFWGQMSNYAGPPEYAVPKPQPGEQVGCCLPLSTMHTRYLPWLRDFTRQATGAGYHVGYYAQPGGGALDTVPGADFLASWLSRNQTEYAANAFYIDVLGNDWRYGSPAAVRNFLQGNVVPRDTVIEHWVDVYPRAPLLSGYIGGMPGWAGGPGVSPATSPRMTFINLARFLMGDRIGYLGESNSEGRFFGPTQAYWLERQIFLLGTKSDIVHPDLNFNPATPNPYLVRIKRLRDRAGWWARRPRYVDTAGLTAVPAGMEARRFIAGCDDLIALDNPAQRQGGTFKLRGQLLPIPPAPLSIVIVNRQTGQYEFIEAP